MKENKHKVTYYFELADPDRSWDIDCLLGKKPNAHRPVDPSQTGIGSLWHDCGTVARLAFIEDEDGHKISPENAEDILAEAEATAQTPW